jgi:2-dehydro-3-deoxyphosphogluconate aldolase/(4S)-4-hydroxy-2-oxoglutarate aldolase
MAVDAILVVLAFNQPGAIMSLFESMNKEIASRRIIPLISVDDAASAGPLADAILAGGLPVVEIAFRTDAAADAIAAVARSHADMLLGAGTVLNVENLKRAHDAGAAFALAPGFNPAVVRAAIDMDFPFYPGVQTPTDIEAALAMGLTTLKFFPASTAGGPATIKALSGPYGPAGVRFVPTGGVNQENMNDYLALPTVVAIGGSWLAKRNDIAAGNWDVITENCRKAVELLED